MKCNYANHVIITSYILLLDFINTHNNIYDHVKHTHKYNCLKTFKITFLLAYFNSIYTLEEFCFILFVFSGFTYI